MDLTSAAITFDLLSLMFDEEIFLDWFQYHKKTTNRLWANVYAALYCMQFHSLVKI